MRFVVVGWNDRSCCLEELAVAHRAVADERLPRHVELVGLARPGADGEHLTALCIEHGRPTAQGVEGRRAGHRQVEGERERPRHGKADADAREAARPAADDDRLEPARIVDQLVDREQQIAGAVGARARARRQPQTAPKDVAVSKAKIVFTRDPNAAVRFVDVDKRNRDTWAGPVPACSGHSTKATVPSKYGSRSPTPRHRAR